MRYLLPTFIICLLIGILFLVETKNEDATYKEHWSKYITVPAQENVTLPFLVENVCLDGYQVYLVRRHSSSSAISIMYRRKLIENTITLVRCGDK